MIIMVIIQQHATCCTCSNSKQSVQWPFSAFPKNAPSYIMHPMLCLFSLFRLILPKYNAVLQFMQPWVYPTHVRLKGLALVLRLHISLPRRRRSFALLTSWRERPREATRRTWWPWAWAWTTPSSPICSPVRCWSSARSSRRHPRLPSHGPLLWLFRSTHSSTSRRW